MLIIGLVFGTPLIDAIAHGLFGTPPLYSVAFTVVLIGILYATILFRTKTLGLALTVALIVTSMFGANIPFASAAALRQFQGNLGPQLWLLEVPLILLVGYFAVYKRSIRDTTSRTELLFAGFVGWSLVVALVGNPAGMDAALYFTLRMLVGLLAFGVSMRAVRTGVIGYTTALTVFCATVVAQAIFAGVQLAAGHSFRLTVLGEAVIPRLDPIVYPNTGFTSDIIAGAFTGHGYILGILSVLVIPILLVSAVKAHRKWSVVLFSTTLYLILITRTSGSDSIRGGILIVLGTALLGVALAYYGLFGSVQTRITALREKVAGIGAVLFGVFAIVFYPSKRMSVIAQESKTQPTPETTTTATTTTATQTTSTTTTGQTVSTTTEATTTTTTTAEATAPATTWGHRWEQYRAGIEAFVENPLFGVGGGNFNYVSGTVYGPMDIHRMAVHNIYIGLLAETGLPGFLLYMGAILSVFVVGCLALLPGSKLRLETIGVMSGLLGVLGIAFWTHSPIDRITAFVPFWILCGLLVGNYYTGRES
ncbi:hypothetical protein GCM10009000_012990 [Halobacterium noricense]